MKTDSQLFEIGFKRYFDNKSEVGKLIEFTFTKSNRLNYSAFLDDYLYSFGLNSWGHDVDLDSKTVLPYFVFHQPNMFKMPFGRNNISDQWLPHEKAYILIGEKVASLVNSLSIENIDKALK